MGGGAAATTKRAFVVQAHQYAVARMSWGCARRDGAQTGGKQPRGVVHGAPTVAISRLVSSVGKAIGCAASHPAAEPQRIGVPKLGRETTQAARQVGSLSSGYFLLPAPSWKTFGQLGSVFRQSPTAHRPDGPHRRPSAHAPIPSAILCSLTAYQRPSYSETNTTRISNLHVPHSLQLCVFTLREERRERDEPCLVPVIA